LALCEKKLEKNKKMPRFDHEAWKWAQSAPFELIIGVLGAKSLGEAEFGLQMKKHKKTKREMLNLSSECLEGERSEKSHLDDVK